MGFKTDYKDITLKELCNLNCIMKHREVVLRDYSDTPEHPIILSEDGCTVDDIPEIFADWFVEYIDINFYIDQTSGQGHSVYRFGIKDP